MVFRNATYLDMENMNKFWNEEVAKEDFFKPITENYKEKLESIPGFSYDGVFLALDNTNEEKLVGMIILIIKSEGVGAINSILVHSDYQNMGIGDKLYKMGEEYLRGRGCKKVFAYGYLPSCYGWYIPNTDHHDHPCAAGIRVNSKEYFFLYHHGYEPTGFQDAFHLNLSDYEISEDIQKILDNNKKDGITIEMYDKNKHFGLEEFYKDLNLYDFEKVIRENLALENPYPFLVVSNNGKVSGWTGALWNEESGRGHFDGIAILESVRGRGLGKALFSLLAYNSKLNGAKFMTFYTGLTNKARYIYMGAGFKIIQTFAIMKKDL